MGSNYNYGGDGRINIGNEGGLSSSSSSSSRKGKKGGGGSDKPKQPQRGLGVAQLEKIRLHSQLTAAAASNYLPLHNPYHPPTFTQEDMRIQTAYSSSSSSSFSYSPPSSTPYGGGYHGVNMMGLQDLDRTNIRYGDTQSSSIPRWHQGDAAMGNQHLVEPIITTRPFFDHTLENTKKEGSSSRQTNPDSRSSEEIDLELRLSL